MDAGHDFYVMMVRRDRDKTSKKSGFGVPVVKAKRSIRKIAWTGM